MKKTVFFLMLLGVMSWCFAQDLTVWQNLRISGLTPAGLHFVRCETIAEPFDTLEVFYKKNNTIWFNQMETLNGLSLQTAIPQPDTDTKGVGLRLINDLFGYMQPLKLENSTTVTALHMVMASRDSINEEVLEGNLKLDIESFHFAFSQEKLYAGIKNRQGTYPNFDSIIGPFYIYGAGFVNPENVMDTTGYAMIYANIPGFFTPGLYKIHGVDFTDPQNIDLNAIQRVGDITTSINNNMLILKCDLSLITNDPNFGTWPTLSRTLAFVPFIVKVNIADLQNVTGDVGHPAMIRFNDLMANETNQIPVLSDPVVIHTNNTSIINVNYTDPDGNFPFYSVFTLNGVDYPMQTISPDFSNTVTYSTVVPAIDWTTGNCSFSDDSTHVAQLEIINEVSNQDQPEIKISELKIYPNPVRGSDNMITLKSTELPKINQISIYNIKGQKVSSMQVNPTKSDMTIQLDPNKKLNTGIYFIKCSGIDQQIIKKIYFIKG